MYNITTVPSSLGLYCKSKVIVLFFGQTVLFPFSQKLCTSYCPFLFGFSSFPRTLSHYITNSFHVILKNLYIIKLKSIPKLYILLFSVTMNAAPKHERRWASDTVPEIAFVSGGTSPGTESYSVADEYVEVTLDVQDDHTIVLRGFEPVTAVNVDDGYAPSGNETPVSSAWSPSIRRSSPNRWRQFSQELKAEAVAKARQFSQELKAELRRFSWSQGGSETAVVRRDLRKQRAQLERNSSGAKKALRGLKFISSKSNGVDGWKEVQSNFDSLAKDGFLYRSDFAQCIGSIYF